VGVEENSLFVGRPLCLDLTSIDETSRRGGATRRTDLESPLMERT
jgi:hypothetical protein